MSSVANTISTLFPTLRCPLSTNESGWEKVSDKLEWCSVLQVLPEKFGFRVKNVLLFILYLILNCYDKGSGQCCAWNHAATVVCYCQLECAFTCLSWLKHLTCCIARHLLMWCAIYVKITTLMGLDNNVVMQFSYCLHVFRGTNIDIIFIYHAVKPHILVWWTPICAHVVCMKYIV